MQSFKVICWALLFIFKLRFPPGVSIATLLAKSCVETINETSTDTDGFCNVTLLVTSAVFLDKTKGRKEQISFE
jgi:hypothetical protein